MHGGRENQWCVTYTSSRFLRSSSCVEQAALSCAAIEVVQCLSKLHSLLVPGATHDAISHCLMPGSWRVFPGLIAELLVLVLADARDHETLVVYNHRDVSAMDYLMMFVYQHTYAARFCAFRLRCAGVKGSFSSDVAILCRIRYSRSSSTLNSTVGGADCT
jgi:hypothetical protein